MHAPTEHRVSLYILLITALLTVLGVVSEAGASPLRRQSTTIRVERAQNAWLNLAPTESLAAVQVAGLQPLSLAAAESVLVVFDPDLGQVTGGGWFYWPGTADPDSGYAGDKTNVSYTARYHNDGSVKGNLLLIRHLPDGSIHRFKSEVMEGLALGEADDPNSGDSYSWASFRGAGDYRDSQSGPPQDGYTFLAYAEDRGQPNEGSDRFWIRVNAPDGQPLAPLTMAEPTVDEAQPLQGGNLNTPR